MNSIRLAIYNMILRPIPSARFSGVRVWWLRKCGVVIGKNCEIQENVRIKGGGSLVLGDDVTLRSGAFIECGNSIKIGNRVEINYGTILAANCQSEIIVEDDVHIAHLCSLKGSTHEISSNGKSVAGKCVFKNITIGEGSWLCAGAIVLPDVTIGKRNIVAAGAVVLHSTDDNVLMAGVPAVPKKIYGDVE